VRACEAAGETEGTDDARLPAGAEGQAAGASGQLVGARRAGDPRPGEDDPGGEREESAGEAAHVLVGHGPEHENERRPSGEVRGERARASGVVGAVEDEGGIAAPALQPSRPPRAGHGLGQPAEVDGETLRRRRLQQPDGDEQVVALVRAGQGPQARVATGRGREVDRVARTVAGRRGLPSARGSDSRAAPGLDQPRAGLAGPLADGPPRLGRQPSDHGRAPRPHDPRLLPGDRGEGPAQVHLVVVVDADDGGGQGLRDVRGVEPAAEAHLEDGHLHALAPEVREGGGGEHLEEGGVGPEDAAANEALGRFAHGAHRDLEVVVGDLAAPHGDPLVDADEVRRGVAPGSQTRRAEHGVAVGGDRSLAVRARDEERRVRALGVAHLGDEGAHRPEAELDPEPHAPREVETGNPVGGQTSHGHASLQRTFPSA
jgi:hypothetical protein